jgi:hypothetical protein
MHFMRAGYEHTSLVLLSKYFLFEDCDLKQYFGPRAHPDCPAARHYSLLLRWVDVAVDLIRVCGLQMMKICIDLRAYQATSMTVANCAGDKYVQTILKAALPLAENTLECTIPRDMLGDSLPAVMIWYRTMIEELQRVSTEVWYMDLRHSAVMDAVITPEAEIKIHFFFPRIYVDVRLHNASVILVLC